MGDLQAKCPKTEWPLINLIYICKHGTYLDRAENQWTCRLWSKRNNEDEHWFGVYLAATGNFIFPRTAPWKDTSSQGGGAFGSSGSRLPLAITSPFRFEIIATVSRDVRSRAKTRTF
nr:hypothetical protein [Desulfobacterales bacterium]